MNNPNVHRFLNRIGYHEEVQVSLASLSGIILQFLRSVPFENFDIVWGQPISLQSPDIFQKIVQNRRGGFCYENNSLLAEMLSELGFSVTTLSARMVKDGSVGPEFDHMVLRVDLDQSYLVDVGNGRSFREPLPIAHHQERTAEGVRYRVAMDYERCVEECADGEDHWTPKFFFSMEPRDRADFEAMCQYHQSSKDSPFTQKSLATLARDDGRITLLNGELTIESAAGKKTQSLSPDGIAMALWQHFGIVKSTE